MLPTTYYKKGLFIAKRAGKYINTRREASNTLVVKPAKKRSKVTKGLKTKIQKVIDSNMEDKYAYKSIININYNSGIDSAGDLNFILPNISNGVTDNARIGDQVKLKSLSVRGHIITNLTYNTYSQCRIGIRLMVVQPKLYTSLSAISANALTWLPLLLKKGATTTNFTGAVSDLYAPVNTDVITTYYDKIIYMQSPYIAGTNTGDVSGSRTTKFFNIKFKVKNKLLRYDAGENSGLTPVNFNPVLIIGYAHLDSAIPDTVNTQINLSWDSMMYYQDA